MKKSLSLVFARIISLAAIAVGLVLLAVLANYQVRSKALTLHVKTGSSVTPAVVIPPPAAISGHPNEISIPSLSIDLPVIDGAYDSKNQSWTLTLNKAQYALLSTLPNNQTGNTLIYGHYRPEVFARLHLIQPGAEAVVMTDNHHRFNYVYQSSVAYDPTDTSIFAYNGRPRLAVQTCSGAFMQHRQMYYFKFQSVTTD